MNQSQYIAVYKDSREPVLEGAELLDFRGEETFFYRYIMQNPEPGKSGKVLVSNLDGDRVFYPGVFPAIELVNRVTGMTIIQAMSLPTYNNA